MVNVPDVPSYKVVAIGGGTGLSTLLRGLKCYVPAAGELLSSEGASAGAYISDLTAVVTATDDGGSSGRLRRDFNVVAPGDLRNCMVALAEDEGLMARLFQFRFPGEATDLGGHSFGNLFLVALTSMTGDFAEAVRLSSEILAVQGNIFPSTTANVQLEALMEDGSVVAGETNINASDKRISELRIVPPDADPLPATLDAIANADLITIGPGSLFTSLVPNLLVRGIPEAIAASRAMKVFVCNLMTEANESLGLTAAGHIRVLYQHARGLRFDYALVNTAPVPQQMRAAYAEESASQIVADTDAIRALGVEPIEGNFLDCGATARHATQRVAAELIGLLAANGSTDQSWKVRANVE